MRTFRSMDSPWRRLPWTLPTALLIWAAALWGLAYFMEKPIHRPVEPPPIDAELIEQAVPPPIETPSSKGSSNEQSVSTPTRAYSRNLLPPRPSPSQHPRSGHGRLL